MEWNCQAFLCYSIINAIDPSLVYGERWGMEGEGEYTERCTTGERKRYMYIYGTRCTSTSTHEACVRSFRHTYVSSPDLGHWNRSHEISLSGIPSFSLQPSGCGSWVCISPPRISALSRYELPVFMNWVIRYRTSWV